MTYDVLVLVSDFLGAGAGLGSGVVVVVVVVVFCCFSSFGELLRSLNLFSLLADIMLCVFRRFASMESISEVVLVSRAILSSSLSLMIKIPTTRSSMLIVSMNILFECSFIFSITLVVEIQMGFARDDLSLLLN